ncbi:hypothetical protein H2201_006546 [Coniosporium apollinis]|uniref:AB hydrolase-1 domain-containing protein n=2 Tax=Coniosporium TaxID=2810619 RepID=A0ABQ9NMD7_9PEZI|nr:hypothetical protein H2199_003779 [Cladosporium sp. JES 115]KAJ9661354.1 hypothetical protein H2201_006546 [Coniosporium apollinis]
MTLPDPAYSFTIPSLHDDTPLDCRIYHPPELGASASSVEDIWQKRGAVIAHPYAPLGGCYDDPIVSVLGQEVLRQGFVVGTFNFRGAGTSHGRTSWSGKAELADYVSFAGCFIHYLHNLQLSPSPYSETHKLQPIPSSSPRPLFLRHTSGPPPPAQPIKLILGGYSYGSLTTTHLPATSTLLQRFVNPEPGTAAAEILLRARVLADQTSTELSASATQRGRSFRRSRQSLTIGGEETPPDIRRRSRETSRRSLDVPRSLKVFGRKASDRSCTPTPADDAVEEEDHAKDVPDVSTAYLLISPILPPTSTLIAPSLAKAPPGEQNITRRPTLIVYGDKDSFASAKKMRKWVEELKKEAGWLLWTTEVHGAGHFWREDGVERELRDAVREWASAVASGSEGQRSMSDLLERADAVAAAAQVS